MPKLWETRTVIDAKPYLHYPDDAHDWQAYRDARAAIAKATE